MKIDTLLIKSLKIVCLVLLVAIPVSYLFHNSENVRQILTGIMFVMIGVAYFVAAYVWNNKIWKALLFVCGAYLIAMNFIPESDEVSMIGIVCIIGPLFIFRFTENDGAKKSLFTPGEKK